MLVLSCLYYYALNGWKGQGYICKIVAWCYIILGKDGKKVYHLGISKKEIQTFLVGHQDGLHERSKKDTNHPTLPVPG